MTPLAFSPSPDTSLHLRQTFAAQLPRRLDEIMRQVRALEIEIWNPRRVDFLHRLVHSLSASADSFGMPDVALVARPLEVNLARLLGRSQAPKQSEIQRIGDTLDELLRVVQTQLVGLELPAAEKSLSSSVSGKETGGALVIYLLRDIPEQARSLQQVLTDASYQVRIFADLDNLCTTCLDGHWPHIVLIDLAQSEQATMVLQALQRLRQAGPSDLQLLMLGARADLAGRLAMYRAGANHCLLRPLQTDQLLSLLAQWSRQVPVQPWRVLLLGDDASWLARQQAVLQDQCIEVQSAQGSAQALMLLESFDAELVVLENTANMSELACLLHDMDPQLNLAFQAGQGAIASNHAEILPEEASDFVAAVCRRAQRQRELQQIRGQLSQLRATRAREHELVQQHAMISIADTNGKMTYVNDKFCRGSGYSRPELIGHSHRILKSGQHAQAFYQDLWRSISHGHIWHGEICNRNKEGGLYWLETSIAPILDEAGRVQYFMAIHTEVSASKQQEKALQDAQRLAKLGNWDDSQHLAWSEVMQEHGVANSVSNKRGNLRADETGDFLAADGDVLEVVHRVVRVDGQVRYVRESGRSIVGSDGRLSRSNGAVQDVTSQRLPSLQEARATVEMASRNKSEILANMSAQLRAPLNAILAYAQLLQMEGGMSPAAAAIQQGAHEIAKSGQHLLTLVNDILDLARLEIGPVEIQSQAVALQALFVACEAQTVALAAAHGISLGFDLGECVQAQVWGDAARLRQVLLNLIANAIKYNRPHGKVQVSACMMPAEPGSTGQARLQIAVSDTGYGLSAEKMARLYTPFDRLGAEQGNIKGTGIGLLIARQLMQIMGGQMGVESTPGLGSVFWLELAQVPSVPAAKEQKRDFTAVLPQKIAVQQEERMTQGKLAQSPPDLARQRKVVLYIEDNAASQRLMHKVLAKRGDLEMVDAISAEAGLPLAQQLAPALILLDINLPGLDGYQALAQLRAMPGLAHTPVVAVTANAMKGDAERGLAAGFTAYVAKPLDIEQFYVLLEHLLGPPQLH